MIRGSLILMTAMWSLAAVPFKKKKPPRKVVYLASAIGPGRVKTQMVSCIDQHHLLQSLYKLSY